MSSGTREDLAARLGPAITGAEWVHWGRRTKIYVFWRHLRPGWRLVYVEPEDLGDGRTIRGHYASTRH